MLRLLRGLHWATRPAVATQARLGIADVTGMGRIDTMILMKPAKADLNLVSRAPALQSSSTPPNRGRALHRAGNPVATGARWSAYREGWRH